MPYRDPNVGRQNDRERYHRRVAERRAAGLCPKCGKQPRAPDRSICPPCAGKARAAGRARDARLRAAGQPRRDKERARAYERERSRRQTADRVAGGVCTKCGINSAESGRRMCEHCAGKRREYDRTRYAEARGRGELYGGKDPEFKRKAGRAASARRRRNRIATGRCTCCGREPAREGSTVCASCLEARRVADRDRYRRRRAAGLCVICGQTAFADESRCGVCATVEGERRDRSHKNARSRQRYWARRAAHRCTDCNRPSFGASRCPACAERSYARSEHVRGMPLYPPSYTIVNPATGEDLGTWDSWEEVAMCLAFERLDLDDVEVLVDQSPMASLTAWA